MSVLCDRLNDWTSSPSRMLTSCGADKVDRQTSRQQVELSERGPTRRILCTPLHICLYASSSCDNDAIGFKVDDSAAELFEFISSRRT